MSTRFAFTKIFVEDIEAEADFYAAVFGMKEKNRLTVDKEVFSPGGGL